LISDWKQLSNIDRLSRVLESKWFSQQQKPVVRDYPHCKRILVLSPHPDDDMIGAGGVLLKSLHNGCLVKTICLTTGERVIEGEMVEAREQETTLVSAVSGIVVEFWRYSAHTWTVDAQSIRRFHKVMEEWKPQVVFLPFLADDHEDHRRASELWYEAFKANPMTHEVWAYQVYSTVLSNVVVDVTAVMKEKIRLVRMFVSQMKKRDWAHYISGLNALNSRFLHTAEPRYAEAFFVAPAQEYQALCEQYFGKGSDTI